MAYIVNMLIMGFWHGVTWYYIAYGLFHGLGLVINDAWVRKKKTLNKERKSRKAALPENRWIQLLGMVVTFHVVMLSFLIFSGFLNNLWFKKIKGNKIWISNQKLSKLLMSCLWKMFLT